MAIRYRVYIGEASEDNVTTLALEHFSAATITRGRGLWEGQTEDTTVVEVIDTGDISEQVAAFARRARRIFEQDAVLVTSEGINATLVTD